jgi:hypothetical protein
MDLKEWDHLNKLAREAADRESPPPAFDPEKAGLVNGGIALLAIVAFIGIAIPDYEPTWYSISGPVVAAFLIPYVVLRNQKRRNQEAWSRHMERLRRERSMGGVR